MNYLIDNRLLYNSGRPHECQHYGEGYFGYSSRNRWKLWFQSPHFRLSGITYSEYMWPHFGGVYSKSSLFGLLVTTTLCIQARGALFALAMSSTK